MSFAITPGSGGHVPTGPHVLPDDASLDDIRAAGWRAAADHQPRSWGVVGRGGAGAAPVESSAWFAGWDACAAYIRASRKQIPPAGLVRGGTLWEGLTLHRLDADARRWETWHVGVCGGYDPGDLPDEITVEIGDVLRRTARGWRCGDRRRDGQRCPATENDIRVAFAGWAIMLPVRARAL